MEQYTGTKKEVITKICYYCQKTRRAELMYRENRKNYKYTPICHFCRYSKQAGKVLDKKTRQWVGKRKKQVPKPVNIFKKRLTKKDYGAIGIQYSYLSEQTAIDFLD